MPDQNLVMVGSWEGVKGSVLVVEHLVIDYPSPFKSGSVLSQIVTTIFTVR